MKSKILILLVLLVQLGNMASSQEYVKFGIIGGGDYTTKFHTSNYQDAFLHQTDNYKLGYAFGMASEIGIIKNLSVLLEPELLKAGSSNGWIQQNNSYLNFPLEFKLFGNKFLSPFAGGYFSYLVSNRIREESGGSNWNSVYATFTHYDFGLNFGVSIKISERIRLNVKYIYGLSDSNKRRPFNNDTFTSMYVIPRNDYNRGFVVYLTYFFKN
jgi:hypothetical protein